MTTDRVQRNPSTVVRRVAGLAAALALVVAACGGSSTTTAPSVAPSVAPSTAASVAPSVAPSTAASTAASVAPSVAAIPSPEAGTFKMGTEPWLGYGPWWIAKAKDTFGANGVTATVTSFDTDDQINAALVSGKIDGANIATHTALRLISSGTPITIVLLLDQSNSADAMIAGPGITSITDLKGKKVAYEEGTTSDILLRYALSQNNMTINDIVKVPTPAAEAGIAVIAKKVDAAVTYEPYLTSALKQDSSFKLIYKAEALPGLIGDVFVVRNDYLASHPGQVYGLLKAWGGAVDYYRSNTTDAQGIIEKAIGANPGDLKTAFDGVQIYGLPEAKALMTGGDYLKTLALVKKVATDAGIITSPVDETKVMDTSFITALVP
jgi:NitT/TauT family transport system substrate-binding protein